MERVGTRQSVDSCNDSVQMWNNGVYHEMLLCSIHTVIPGSGLQFCDPTQRAQAEATGWIDDHVQVQNYYRPYMLNLQMQRDKPVKLGKSRIADVLCLLDNRASLYHELRLHHLVQHLALLDTPTNSRPNNARQRLLAHVKQQPDRKGQHPDNRHCKPNDQPKR